MVEQPQILSTQVVHTKKSPSWTGYSWSIILAVLIPHPIVNVWNPAWYDRSLICLDPVFAPCILGFLSSRLWSWKPKPTTFHFSPRNPITPRNDGLIKLVINILTYLPPTTLTPTRNTPGLKPPPVQADGIFFGARELVGLVGSLKKAWIFRPKGLDFIRLQPAHGLISMSTMVFFHGKKSVSGLQKSGEDGEIFQQ